jgi:LacI family transcriptional regulator
MRLHIAKSVQEVDLRRSRDVYNATNWQSAITFTALCCICIMSENRKVSTMTKKSSSKLKMPTMYDVAKLAGVSQPTVSRVLNQNDTTVQISDETRQRVLAAVEELGYRPNILARSLRTQRTQTVALLVADLSNAFYHIIARAVQDVAREHNYEVLISNSDHLYENEKHFCDVVSRRLVDGVMMVPIHLTEEDLDEFLTTTNIPITTLGGHLYHPYIDSVHVDDEKASYEAVRWLVEERGYQSVGYIGVSDDLPPNPRRYRGYTHALHDCGLTVDPRFVLRGDFSLESGVQVAHEMLQIGELPRALYVINDLMAIGVLLTLQEAGVRVPEDVAILGFDNIWESEIVRPKLTTIAQDPRDIGRVLAEALFERIENPNILQRREFESKYELIVRDSA